MTQSEEIRRVRDEMLRFYSGDPKRVFHFLKVHDIAKDIAEREKIAPREAYITELAALVHDIGIPAAIENYGSSAGKYQEFEGPTLAGEMLERIGFEADTIDRVCFLVSVHHTPVDVVGEDWQILLEADFIVNALEEGYSEKQIQAAKENIFKTTRGKELLDTIYNTAA